MRRGVTPVVAIVLLLMMTVGAAGGAYAWMQTLQEGAQAEAESGLRTDVAVQDVVCRGKYVEVAMKNRGATDLDASDVRFYVYRDDDLIGNTAQDLSTAGFAEAGGFGRARFSVPSFMDVSSRYRVEIDFRTDSYTVRSSCFAEQARTCRDIHRMGFESNGTYTVDPDGDDVGIAPFDVTCDMDTDGGGWFKVRMDNRLNQYWWTKKNSDIDDGESRDPGGSTYSGWDWTPFSHISSNADVGTYDFASYTGVTELELTWHQYGNASNTYSRVQMDAIRDVVDEISDTTEAFSTSSDDDGCRNGEAVLKLTEGGSGYLITHYTTSSGQFIRNFETTAEMNDLNDVRYLIPAVLQYENGGPCSGAADFVAFGYEKDYTLVR